VDGAQLQRRCAAESIDHQQLGSGEREIGRDGVQTAADEMVERFGRDTFSAPLTMDPDAELDFTSVENEARFLCSIRDPAAQCHSDTARGVDDPLPERTELFKIQTGFGGGTTDLLDHDGGDRAATTGSAAP